MRGWKDEISRGRVLMIFAQAPNQLYSAKVITQVFEALTSITIISNYSGSNNKRPSATKRQTLSTLPGLAVEKKNLLLISPFLCTAVKIKSVSLALSLTGSL